MTGFKSSINGVDIAYGLSWESKNSGKCHVEITTPQGKLYGIGGSDLDGCVSIAAYVAQEVEDGIFLWETETSGKWLIVGITGGIIAPGSDVVVDIDALEESVEEMQVLVGDNPVFVIGEGVPPVDFDIYDASNIDNGEKLNCKKLNIKLIAIVFVVVLGIAGKIGYDMYLEQKAKEEAAIAAQAAAIALVQKHKKMENDIFTLSKYDTPLNNKGVLKNIYSIQTNYEGWELESYTYPKSVGILKKSKYSYLNNLVNKFGDKVSWNNDGTKAKIQFNSSRPEKAYPFNKGSMFYMKREKGVVYDISLLQRLQNLGYVTNFTDKPYEWGTSMVSYPEKYSIMYLGVSGKMLNLKAVLNLFDKFGYVVGKIEINKSNNSFKLELAHYMAGAN